MSERMLVETVYERRGFRMEPIVQTPEEIVAKKEVLFRRVPVIIPVGVMVGINDIVNGIGLIRTGWSKCKLPPAKKPLVLDDDTFNSLIPEGKELYHARHAAYEKAVRNSDTFNLERGIAEACQNIFFPPKDENGKIKLPQGRGFGKKYEAFQDRCNRYFKDVIPVCNDGVITGNPRYVPPALPPEIREIQRFIESVMGPIQILGYGVIPGSQIGAQLF